MWYGITFSAVQEFVMLRDSFIEIAVVSKNRECSMAVVANKTFPILCFCLGITRTFHPPYTPDESHCNMDILRESIKQK